MGCGGSSDTKKAATTQQESGKPPKGYDAAKDSSAAAAAASGAQMEQQASEKKVKFHDLYKLHEVLGEGSYCIVYRATVRATGKKVAVKILSKKGRETENDEESFKIESDILKGLDHAHIVKYYGNFEDKYNLYMILEYLSGGELFDRILERSHYSEEAGREASIKILQSVKHLHDHDIIHRDLKPENVLLASRENDTDIKLVDFGFAVRVGPSHMAGQAPLKRAGTPAYVAPEVVDQSDIYGEKNSPTKNIDTIPETIPEGQVLTTGEAGTGSETGTAAGVVAGSPSTAVPAFVPLTVAEIGKASDMWSVGVIIFMLLSGYPPFFEETTDLLFRKIVAAEYVFNPLCWENVSEEAMDLVKGLLTRNPARRLTVDQALKHPWFTKLSSDHLSQRNLSQTLISLKENRDSIMAYNYFHKKVGSWATVLGAFGPGAGEYIANKAADLASSAAEAVVDIARSFSSQRIDISRKYSSGMNLINANRGGSGRNLLSQASKAAESLQQKNAAAAEKAANRQQRLGTPTSASRGSTPSYSLNSPAPSSSSGPPSANSSRRGTPTTAAAAARSNNGSNSSDLSSSDNNNTLVSITEVDVEISPQKAVVKKVLGSPSGKQEIRLDSDAGDDGDDRISFDRRADLNSERISLDRRPPSATFTIDPKTGKIQQLQPSSSSSSKPSSSTSSSKTGVSKISSAGNKKL